MHHGTIRTQIKCNSNEGRTGRKQLIMSTTKPYLKYDTVVVILASLFSVSLIYSVYLLSISMFLFGVLSLLSIGDDGKIEFKLRADFISKVDQMLSSPAWWIISVSFFLVLFGGLYSHDTSYWFSRLRLKVPFLLLPIAFYLLPKVSNRTYLYVHLIFTVVVFMSTLPIAGYMSVNYAEVIDSLQHGRPIKTPISHIRYSLLISLAIASSFLLAKDDEMPPVPRRLLRFGLLYLIFFLHFLAVRSGLVAFYSMTLIYFFLRLFTTGKIFSSMAILSLFILLPFAAYQTIPSFKERILYMLEDVSKYQSQEWNAYSDAERILSMKAGLDIAKSHPWFGTGSADLREEMKAYFYQHFDKDTYIMPHNQFISILAANGILGLILFVLAFFVPLLINYAFRNPFFLALHIIVLVSLMVENTFETSVGVAFYLYFVLIGLNHLKHQEVKPNDQRLKN